MKFSYAESSHGLPNAQSSDARDIGNGRTFPYGESVEYAGCVRIVCYGVPTPQSWQWLGFY